MQTEPHAPDPDWRRYLHPGGEVGCEVWSVRVLERPAAVMAPCDSATDIRIDQRQMVLTIMYAKDEDVWPLPVAGAGRNRTRQWTHCGSDITSTATAGN